MAADFKARLTLNDKNFNAKLEGACRKAQAQLQNVSKASGVLGKSMGGAAGQISGIIGGFSKLTGPAALATAGFVGVAASLKDVVENGAKFELALDHLQSLTGVTADKMEVFKTKILNTGIAIHKSASEVADAYGIVGSKMPELLQNEEALDQVVQAASTLGKAGLMPLEESISALTNIMNLMGATSSQAEQYINVLAAGSKNGAGNIQYLSEAFTKAGTNMSAANISFEEGVALIEALSKKFPDAAIAGTRLNKVILALETLNNDKYKPSVVGLSEALHNLALISDDTKKMTEMFGSANVSAARTLADMADEVDILTKKVTGTSEAYDQAAINTDNLASKTAALKVSWENLTTAIGNSIPVMKDAVSWFGKILDAYATYLNYGGDFDKIGFDKAVQNEIKASQLHADKKIKGGMTPSNAYASESKHYHDEAMKIKELADANLEYINTLKQIKKQKGYLTSDETRELKLRQKKQKEYNEQIKAHNKLILSNNSKYEQARDAEQKKKDKKLVLDNDKTPTTPTKSGRSTVSNTQKEADAAAGSLRALEKELLDYQNQYYKGLLPDVSVDEFLKEVKNKEKKIEDERIRLKLDPDPKSLAGLRKTLQDIDNQIERLDPGADPAALLKLRKDTEKSIEDLEVSYKIKPYIAPDSLQKMQDDYQEWLDKVQRGEINLTAEEFQTLKKLKETAIKDKENEIGFSTNLLDIEKEFKEFLENLGRKSSFQIALGEQTPQTLDDQLSQYQDLMDTQDDLINKLKEKMKAEKDGTKAGEEAAAKTQEALNAAIQKQNEYAAAVLKTAEEKKKLEEQETLWLQATGAINDFGASLSNLGSAFELPELNIAGVIAQGIANMALGFAQASLQEGNKGIWFWLAASMAGLAQLTAMIAQIHSITGYAEGGIISGGSTLGDKNLIRVNAGEAILNKNLQRRLWDILDGQRTLTTTHSQNENVSFVLRGADLYGSINNYKRLTKK